MSCPIKNPANYDLGDLEGHVTGMYDHFASKYGFQKPPTMVFDSDPSNQANVLGKTAYYDPQSMEIHVFCDGRHPKDMLRSIAHELIHHRQNLEGRLDTDGYNGPGYYLENDELKEIEHEAMLEGNATMREYEDTKKYVKENKDMSLKEWKNNELNQLLMKKFGILKEDKMPMKDEPEGKDLNDDGKKGHGKVPAFLDEETLEEGELPDGLKKYMADKKASKKSDDDSDSPEGEQEATNEGHCAKRDDELKEISSNAQQSDRRQAGEDFTREQGRLHEDSLEEERTYKYTYEQALEKINNAEGHPMTMAGMVDPRTIPGRYTTAAVKQAFKADLDPGWGEKWKAAQAARKQAKMNEEEVEETVRRVDSQNYPGNRAGQGTADQDRKNMREEDDRHKELKESLKKIANAKKIFLNNKRIK